MALHPIAAPLDVQTASSVEAQFTGAHVLLVEDNVVNQIVGATMLRNLGCEVDVSANGREATERTRTCHYDIVFMDCEMPEMDGYEATAAIRRQPDGHHVPIIAVTAQVMAGDQERCLSAGMDGYISKPVKQEDFVAALHRWVPGKAEQKSDEPQLSGKLEGAIIPAQRRRLFLFSDSPSALANISFALDPRGYCSPARAGRSIRAIVNRPVIHGIRGR